jgi:hypothetical protein
MPGSVGLSRWWRDVTRLRLRALNDHLRESLLFLPVVMMVLAVACGVWTGWTVRELAGCCRSGSGSHLMLLFRC